MNILLSNSSDKPIYEQICGQIKEQVMTGALEAGEALPSMRFLAKELRISVITTKRAYEELEREGFIETVPGKGCFVSAQNPELLKEARLKKVEEALRKAADEAKRNGISLAELHEMLDLLAESEI